jgi:hypothetical protein
VTQWRGIPSVPPTDATSQIFLQSIKENLENVIVLLDPTKYGKAQNTAYLNNDISNLQVSITGVSASVTTETNARVAADNALAQQIQQLIVSGSSAVMTYAQTTAPTSPNLGDIWFDTDDNNKVYRYSGSAWVAVDDLRTVANAAAISTEQTVRLNADNALASSITSLTSLVNTSDATLQANINSEASTRASADTALATRATTLEATVNSATDGNLALKSRIATEETARADGDAANASAITSLTATVGTKNRTFAQSTAPTATATGDLWLNTADSSKTYRWNGSSWVLAADTRIAAVVTESSANATAIGDINAQYSVTVAAGKVTGFKLMSSPTTSSFIVSADYFAVENASGKPFEIVGGNVYLQGNLIQAGSIGINKLATGLQPVEIVDTLPATGNYKGRVAFLNTDSKLYRHNGTNWVTAVASTDISGTIADAQIAAVGATKVTGQLSDAQIATLSAAKVTGQITGTQITDGAISTAKLAAGSVTSNEIAANTITAADIASGTITATEIAAATITGAKIAAGTILAGNIATDTITANQIAANAITATELSSNSVTADKILAGAVTAAKIAVTQLDAVSATIGTLRTATSGARTEISDNVIKVFDASGTLRVKIGNLAL